MEGQRDIEGWSWKNIRVGLIFIGIGVIIDLVAGFFGLSIIGLDIIPTWYSVCVWIASSSILLGLFGFILVIPAFQKWGKTRPWIAWTLLIIVVVALPFCFIFLNMF